MDEANLTVLLKSLKNLPPHPQTKRRDCYVSMRIVERCYERLDEDPRSPGRKQRLATQRTSRLGSSASVVSEEDPLPVAAAAPPPSLVPFGSTPLVNTIDPASLCHVTQRRSSSLNPKHEKILMDPHVQVRKAEIFVDDIKLQSKMMPGQLSPDYFQTFVFNHLNVPVRRQSPSALLNCSAQGASRKASIASSSNDADFNLMNGGHGSPNTTKAYHLKKLDPTFHLLIEVFDNSEVPGAGERIASATVELDSLTKDARQNVNVELEMDIKVAPAGVEEAEEEPENKATGVAGEEQEEEAKAAAPPTVELLLEPHNFGIIKEDENKPMSVEIAIFQALNEELADVFSRDLIKKLHQVLIHVDADNSEGICKKEMAHLLQEISFITGTPVPEDHMLQKEIDYLFNVFDKNGDDSLDISEICTMLRSSRFSQQLKNRWRAPKAGFTQSNVVAAANVAGCLWDASLNRIPEPLTYAGYRRPDGAVNERTRKPVPLAGSTKFEIKNNDHLYAEMGIKIPGSIEEEEQKSGDNSPNKAGDNDNAGHRKSITTSLIQEKAQESTFGETLDHKIVENYELQHCTLNNCHLINCTLKGGVVSGGNIESCILKEGVDVRFSSSMRCCKVSYSRIHCSHPTNCFIEHSVVKQCPLVMQTTMQNCELQESSIVHCKLRRSTIDDKVRDDGANLIEMCTMQSSTFYAETLNTVETTEKEVDVIPSAVQACNGPAAPAEGEEGEDNNAGTQGTE